MSMPDSKNRPIPAFLRLVTWIECGVVFAAAAALFFLPVAASRIWAWSPPPFNSRYIGAIYFAALLPLVVMAARGRWSPGRMVLWMIFTFTFSIMVVMFFHAGQFEWGRWATWAFWFLYIFLPINSAVFLRRLRGWGAADPQTPPKSWMAVVQILAVILGLYGLALLVIPEAATAFWPWPVDAFHGRIYAATFLTPAVGAWLIRRQGSRWEYITLGLTLATLGAFSIAGTVWTSATVPPDRQADYGAIGTWIFLGMNAVSLVVGGLLARAGARLREAAA
jgi:hypothetical protein